MQWNQSGHTSTRAQRKQGRQLPFQRPPPRGKPKPKDPPPAKP